MMKHFRFIYFMTVFCLLIVPAMTRAQKKQMKPKTSVSHINTLFEQLLPSAAKIMFIDSVVVDKNEDFLKYIPLDKENGSLTIRNGQMIYENGFENYRIFAYNDTTNRGIYTQNLTGNGFSTPHHRSELSKEILHAGFPFLAPDGKTLYFSGEGRHSVGKRDIFMSVYNPDDNVFYEPENCGLPFNSDANDYMLIIDDFDTLGWLVSDRYQPDGKLCIYAFEPTTVRETLSGVVSSPQQATQIARLRSISDTWAFGNRKKALQRLENLKQRLKKKKTGNDFKFVINDDIVYESMSSFHSQKARQLCAKWIDMSKSFDNMRNNLSELRRDSNKNATTIISLEKKLPILAEEIHLLEKQIRKIENQ